MADTITPEIEAVLDAAESYANSRRHVGSGLVPAGRDLIAAIDAYKESIAPPPPFRATIQVYGDGSLATQGCYDLPVGSVWECEVTPLGRAS